MLARVLTMAASLGVLVLVFVPLERLFPARPGQGVLRRGTGVDAMFFAGQYLLWNGVALTALGLVRGAVWSGASPPSRGLGMTIAACVAAVVLGDLLVYWFHRACHAWAPL